MYNRFKYLTFLGVVLGSFACVSCSLGNNNSTSSGNLANSNNACAEPDSLFWEYAKNHTPQPASEDCIVNVDENGNVLEDVTSVTYEGVKYTLNEVYLCDKIPEDIEKSEVRFIEDEYNETGRYPGVYIMYMNITIENVLDSPNEVWMNSLDIVQFEDFPSAGAMNAFTKEMIYFEHAQNRGKSMYCYKLDPNEKFTTTCLWEIEKSSRYNLDEDFYLEIIANIDFQYKQYYYIESGVEYYTE